MKLIIRQSIPCNIKQHTTLDIFGGKLKKFEWLQYSYESLANIPKCSVWRITELKLFNLKKEWVNWSI